MSLARIKSLHVNGRAYAVDAGAQVSLLRVLRDQVGLTGSKYGCGEGQCGACTVLINGAPRRACVVPVGAVGAKQVTTIEGLAKSGRLHPVQEAFLTEGALQCGYCTSGMIVTAVSLLQSNPDPSAQQIVQYMDGNICRCGTYPRIVAAIRRAAKSLKESGQ